MHCGLSVGQIINFFFLLKLTLISEVFYQYWLFPLGFLVAFVNTVLELYEYLYIYFFIISICIDKYLSCYYSST